jgi:patatin-related protein
MSDDNALQPESGILGPPTSQPSLQADTSPTAQSKGAARRTVLTQTIRLATTMTGGVSLAIWMGGVARELNLLSQASTWRQSLRATSPIPTAGESTTPDDAVRRLYLKLIDLLDVSVSVDVLSGTSAGGINAALLGLSRVRGLDLGELRDLWINIGSMEQLLREPTDSDFPSLMYGDNVILQKLQEQLGTLKSSRQLGLAGFEKAVWVPPPTSLFITTTLLDGETSRFTDSYGTVVQDTDHRGMFTFTEQDLATGSVDALALAARSSSSFPAAFEPAFLPFTQDILKSKSTLPHPAMAGYTSITRPHWVADGGLLANRPLAPLLQAVFDRPANRETRRVLLYIVPSAGGLPSQLSEPDAERFDDPLAMGTSLLKDLGAILEQSISAEIRSIRDHNDTHDEVSGARLRLAELGRDRALLTPGLLDDYKARVGAALASPVISALSRLISTMPAPGKPAADGQQAMPAVWGPDLRDPETAMADCRKAAQDAITTTWSGVPEDYPSLATFGRPAFDGAKAIVISMLRNAYLLAESGPDRQELSEAVNASYSALAGQQSRHQRPRPASIVRETVEQHPHDTLAAVSSAAAERYARGLAIEPNPVTKTTSDPGSSLIPAWQSLAQVIADHATLLRNLSETKPEPVASEVKPDARSQTAIRVAAARTVKIYLDYLTTTSVSYVDAVQVESSRAEGSITEETATAAGRNTGAVHEASPPVERVPDGAQAKTAGVSPSQTGEALSAQIATRLFALHATHRALSPAAGDVPQRLELIQVSADTRTLLDPSKQTAASKLTGMQLHHFGAFYKSSWRANDWMWGRLDGVGWLVHMLLDPKRIATVTALQNQATPASEWFFKQLQEFAGPVLETNLKADDESEHNVLTEQMILKELNYLDDPGRPVPASLPMTALWVAATWQRWVVANELPTLAEEINKDAPGNSTTWTRQVIPPSDDPASMLVTLLKEMARLFLGNPVPTETLAGQVGTPLMSRTASKALATATAAIGGEPRIPKPARPAMSFARTVTLATYRITKITNGTTRQLLIAGVGAVIIGIALAIQQGTLMGFTGTAILLAGALMLVLGLWGLSWRALGAFLSFLAVLAVAMLALPFSRHWLFASGSTNQGLVFRNAQSWVTWLNDAWWHPLLVLGLIAASLSAAYLLGARQRATKRTRRPSAAQDVQDANTTASRGGQGTPHGSSNPPE